MFDNDSVVITNDFVSTEDYEWSRPRGKVVFQNSEGKRRYIQSVLLLLQILSSGLWAPEWNCMFWIIFSWMFQKKSIIIIKKKNKSIKETVNFFWSNKAKLQSSKPKTTVLWKLSSEKLILVKISLCQPLSMAEKQPFYLAGNRRRGKKKY